MGSDVNGPSRAPLPTSAFKQWFWAQIFDLARLSGRYIIVSAAICFCVYQLSIAARAFAGQESNASFTLKLLASVTFHWALTISVSGISVALYLRERNQHQRTRERLSKRVKELELVLDPSRSSSQLTAKGLTRKGDE